MSKDLGKNYIDHSDKISALGDKPRKFVDGLVPIAASTAIAIFVGVGTLAFSLPQVAQAQNANYGVEITPKWNDKGELLQPTEFRALWVYLGSPFTPNALNNGKAGFPEYHNVYVQPSAFKEFRKSGKWPEGTMMLKELQLVDQPKGDEADGSRYEVSGRGYFPGAVNGMDVAVKDSSRFSETKNWGYFNFGHHAPPYAKSAAAAPAAACAQCHIDNAGEDMVFDKFYKPILTPLPLPE